MPIVFEDISTEISPPAQGAPAAATPAAPAGADDAEDTLRERLALWAERLQRLQAD